MRWRALGSSRATAGAGAAVPTLLVDRREGRGLACWRDMHRSIPEVWKKESTTAITKRNGEESWQAFLTSLRPAPSGPDASDRGSSIFSHFCGKFTFRVAEMTDSKVPAVAAHFQAPMRDDLITVDGVSALHPNPALIQI